MNNLQPKLKKIEQNKWCFIRNNAGSVIISFAIILPTIFIFMLISINHSQSMRTRAQISEATNEASLAIVAINNQNKDSASIEQNKKIALNYINYYLNRKIDDNINGAYIDIKFNTAKHEYYVTYRQTFDQMINDELLGESAEKALIANKTNTYGNTRKSYVTDSYDIAFVADFSGSGSCKYNDFECNDYKNGLDDSQRVAYMKEAIADIINEYKYFPEYKFALVPYDIGVPEKNTYKNPAGGESYTCSVMYKMKSTFNKIDYNFWANKNILYTRWSSLKENNIIKDYLNYNYLGNHESNIFYYLDYYYLYYAKIIGPAKGYYNNQQLVDNGLCIFQNYIDQPNIGSAQYACGINNSDYPLSSSNRSIVKNQYAKIVQLYDYMFSGDYPDVHFSFANTKTVDVLGTINTLFSQMDSNTISFNRVISPSIADFSPFHGMCQSPLYNNGIMSDKMADMSHYKIYDEAAKHIESFKSSPHLIAFNEGKNNNAYLIDTVKNGKWQPGGGTDTITALLRTVPVIAKGTSSNKMIIIITDGKDDAGADVLRDQFLKNGACQAIRDGLVSEDNFEKGYLNQLAKSATIHYIKLDPNAKNITSPSDYKKVYGKWYSDCMNNDKQYLHVATDYHSLLGSMKDVLLSETGVFINKN